MVEVSLLIDFLEILDWPIICCFICLFLGSPVSWVGFAGVWSFVRMRGVADGPLLLSIFVGVIL